MEQPLVRLVLIKPEENAELAAFYNEALGLLEYAEARVIASADDLKPATDDLTIIARLKKAMEGKRKEYLQPFQDHIKEVNEGYKKLMAPVERADRITRDKILAFNAEQERKRREQEEINRLRMEAARKEMELNGEMSESLNLVEVIPELAKRTTTEMGRSGMRENWRWEMVDINLVPREYLMINAGVLTPIVKASKGKIVIPGIRVFNEPVLAVNAK